MSEMKRSKLLLPLPQQNESYYLYDIGTSDPNKMLPREFKQHISSLGGTEVSKTTFDRLAELTSQSSKSNVDDFVYRGYE